MPEQLGEVTREGRQYAQQVTFAGGKQAAALWMGLCKQPRPGEPLTLSRASELEPVQASGYGRVMVKSSDWREVRAESGLVSLTATGFWRNSGQDAWPQVDLVFVSTSPDGNGELLAWAPFSHSHVLLNNDELRVPFIVRF